MCAHRGHFRLFAYPSISMWKSDLILATSSGEIGLSPANSTRFGVQYRAKNAWSTDLLTYSVAVLPSRVAFNAHSIVEASSDETTDLPCWTTPSIALNAASISGLSCFFSGAFLAAMASPLLGEWL